MPSLPAARALGALLAAWLLCGVADAAYILSPPAAMVASPAPRLEIRTFMANKYRATLFIRTLLDLQARPVTNLESYTQIAGIHGSPTYFDGVRLGTAGDNGYCQHSRPFFSPWHRPYLMMFERVLYLRATQLAAQYTTADRAQYVAAARALRLPYWDWGLAGGQVPGIFLQSTYTVTLANGAASRVRNPLNRYRIPNDAVTKFEIPTNLYNILRSWTGTTATLGNVRSLRSGLVSMFKTRTFNCFTDDSGCTNTGALEILHNEIHGTVGGDGHMSFLNFAAFDIIFFLHHANVDRQLAIWEGIYPTARMDNIASSRAYPFRKNATTWWTTRDVMTVYDSTKRGTRRFGYYYPELANTAVTPAQLLARVDQLYNDFVGQARTIVTLASIRDSPIDGTTTIKLVTNVTTANTVTNGTAARADQAGSSRRTRRKEVTAGSIPVFTPDPEYPRFIVPRIHVDVTEALNQIKAANPSVTKVDIVATIEPFDNNSTVSSPPPVGQVVSLGKPTVSTTVDGKVVPPPPTPKLPKTSGVKLLSGVNDVKAVVQP